MQILGLANVQTVIKVVWNAHGAWEGNGSSNLSYSASVHCFEKSGKY